ncbi:MAG: helix-turn-helix domain-containing protein [Tabrizicola sp.]|nr:helix-turn-helix domain-containing protein [Tabrizicola sp.]
MNRALGLLQTTDNPVQQIAFAVGYASASRFAVRFRARFGLAPSAIRGGDRDGTVIDRLGTAAE